MPVFTRRDLIAAAVGLLLAHPAWAQLEKLQTFEKGELSIRSGQTYHRFRIEIARRPGQQAQGLMFRRHLDADAGMLFLYSRSARISMWMKNTYIPLDMLFIDGRGTIVSIAQRTVPGSLEVISSEKRVNAVLEVNAGTVARLGIAVGDQVLYPAFRTK